MTSLLLDKTPPFVITGNMREVWTTREREVLVQGAAGTGKTTVDIQLDFHLAMTVPRIRILWLRSTLTSLRQSILVTFEEHVLRGLRHPCMHGKASRDHRTSYRFPHNGAEIVLGGLDDPTKTYSMEYTKVTGFEAIQFGLDSYEKLLRLLRWPHGEYRQARMETNPGPVNHWLNQRCEKELPDGKRQMHRIHTTHQDNPLMWDYVNNRYSQFGEEYIEGALGGLSGHRRANLKLGIWQSAEGLIFEEWDSTVHEVGPQYVPELSTYVAAMDFGTNAPGCLQVWGTDGTGRWWRVAEIYRTGLNINDWADYVAELWAEYRFRVGIADSADGGTGAVDVLNRRLGALEGRYSEAVFIKADKGAGKEYGFQTVRSALDPSQPGGPRIFFVKGAVRHRQQDLADRGKPTCTEEEMPDFTYREPDELKPTREDSNPLKADHGIDATVYFCTWVHGKYRDKEGNAPIKPGSAADVLGWRNKRRPRSA